MAKSIPISERNRLSKLGDVELQRELAVIERLHGMRKKLAEETRTFILTLLQEKAAPALITPKEQKEEKIRELRTRWEAPLSDLCKKVRQTEPPSVEQQFTLYGDIARLAGSLALHTLAKENHRIQWIQTPEEALNAKNKNALCINPKLPYATPHDGASLMRVSNISTSQSRFYTELYEDAQVTPAYAAIKLAETLMMSAKMNGDFGISLGRTPGISEFEFSGHHICAGISLQAADLLTDGEVTREAKRVTEELQIKLYADIEQITPHQIFAPIVTRITRSITRKPALSPLDESVRSHIALYALMSLLPQMEMDAQQITLHLQWAPTVKLHENDDAMNQVQASLAYLQVDPASAEYAKHGDDILFLARRDTLPTDSPLFTYEFPDYENTLDVAVTLDKETDESADIAEKKWVGGILLTKQEMVKNCIRDEFKTEIDRIASIAMCADCTAEEKEYARTVLERFKKMDWKPQPDYSRIRKDNNGNYEYDSFEEERIAYITPSDDLSVYSVSEPQPHHVSRIHHLITTEHDNTSAFRLWNMRSDIIWEIVSNSRTTDDHEEEINKEFFQRKLKIIDKVLYADFDPLQAGLVSEDLIAKPIEFLSRVNATFRPITRKFPQSQEELISRVQLSLSDAPTMQWDASGIEINQQECDDYHEKISLTIESLSEQIATLTPQRIIRGENQDLDEVIDILGGDIPHDPNVHYARSYGHMTFVCRKEHLPTNLSQCVSSDNEETLDLVVNLNLQDEYALETDAWVSGTLPSIEELERELFTQEFVPEKFFPPKERRTVEENELKLHSAEENTGSQEKNDEPLQRMKALRNTLLKNRWAAKFTVDERAFAPEKIQYKTTEAGHYVLVSLPAAKLQILISDDQSKGTYIIRNLIDPEQFTKISIDEFLAQYSATRVKFDSIQQFRDALETEISEQINDPMTIYPVASSYPTPLDTFPNDEAIRLLTRDFTIAATIAEKPMDQLTISDFTSIKSGKVRWSFGGVAGGAAYLDRLATEFGLDASTLNRKLQVDSKAEPDDDATPTVVNIPPEELLEQYELRETILRLLLHEISPKYREERDAYYATGQLTSRVKRNKA